MSALPSRKDRDAREALDELHAQADSEPAMRPRAELMELVRRAPEELRTLPLDDQKTLAEGWTLGESITGWKNPWPKDDPRSLLLEYQARWLEDPSRFKAALQARQTGKDFTSEAEVAQDSFLTPNNRWMVAAPSERQSLDSLEQCKTWCRAWALRIEDYVEQHEGPTSQHLLKSAEITLSNGSRVVAVPGRPDTVRGKSANVLITEADFLENPTETVRAILPSISNPLRGGEKKLRYISTPNGVGNLMHKARTQPSKKMKWSHHTTTILQAVLMGLPVDWEVLAEAFGDDWDGIRQELFCEFLDGSNVLLPFDLIQGSESMEATEVWDPAAAIGQGGPTFLGIDYGRQNDPTVCWTLQLHGGCLWTREVLVIQRTTTPQQEAMLTDRIRASRRTCYDYTGPGIGLGDYLVNNPAIGQWKPEEHKLGRVELCTFTAPFKRELFPTLRRAFEASMPATMTGAKVLPVRIPVSRVIRDDLHQMQQVQTAGQYNYWSERTKNGHSDRCTALALAVRAAGAGAQVALPMSLPGGRHSHARAMRGNRSLLG
jgi:phage FluMu gp28-like protein